MANTEDPLDWSAIDTVLLDMDGTLLDLGFDNWFWLEHVPALYAKTHGLADAEARALLVSRYAAARGRLEWYCLEHWSRALKLDLEAAQSAVLDRARYLPGAQAFLHRLARSGKRRILLTNAHPQTLALKDGRLGVRAQVDESHSTHEFGLPKEHPEFWPRYRARVPFEPARTLLIDDSTAVLAAAAQAGIRWLRAVRRPVSGGPVHETGPYAAVDAVSELW
jgi:5'-nucleotidase